MRVAETDERAEASERVLAGGLRVGRERGLGTPRGGTIAAEMTTAAAIQPRASASAPPSSTSVWLFGPGIDLLFGCGVGYAMVFAISALAGPTLRGAIPPEFGPLVLLFSGTPHYGATLLRAYERSEDRRAYALFTIWITLAVLTCFATALYWPIVGSLMLTLMLTWSPWHYSGQNYGIALMYLGRAGVRVERRTKRLLYASFWCSFALTVLAIHGATPAGQYAPTSFGGSVFSFLPLGIPDGWRNAGFAVFGAAYGATTAIAVGTLLRGARLRQIVPALLLLATQALWFVAPTLARQLAIAQGVEPLGTQYSAYAILWVAVAHSVQYLWISLYYARRRSAQLTTAPFLVKCLLAGATVWAIPGLVLAPGRLGHVPYDLGLAVLISSAVNLHHFLLDGAIWKLRDGRVARFLLRAREEAPEAGAGRSGLRLGWAPLVWAAGVIGVVTIGGATLLTEMAFRPATQRGDVAGAERAYRSLVWLGFDSPSLRAQLAATRARSGDLDRATTEADGALALFPTADAWHAKGYVAQLSGDTATAIGAYESALRLQPAWPEAANDLAWLRATSANPLLRDGILAVALAESAARATGHAQPGVLDTLAAAYASALRFDIAVRVGQRAATLARDSGDEILAGEIESRVALYRDGQPYLLAVGTPTPPP